MKKVLVAALICAASSFAAWDKFPVIEDGKGEAKIAHSECRQGNSGCPGGDDFQIRYSPIDKLEVWAKKESVIGARYQFIPIVSGGVDIGFPIPSSEWTFTPNIQFSTPLTDAIVLGSNVQVTIFTEQEKNLDLSAGVELDLTVGKNTLTWVSCDFNREDLSNEDGGIEIVPALGYVATAGNLSLGANVGMKFGENAGHDKHATFIGFDASVKF